MASKSIDTPISEITLRRYEKPYNLSKRELVRKLCLSLGLLNPGDSRDVIVDIFYVLLNARKEQALLSSEQIREAAIEFRKTEGLDDSGTAGSNVRRQLKRLRDLILVEKVKNNYRITEFLSLDELYSTKIEKYFLPNITARVKEYIKNIDDSM